MILLLGNRGSIGRRYETILKDLRIPHICWDKAANANDWKNLKFDKAIIATPTESHFELCNELLDMNKTVLCEKPLSKSVEECETLVKRVRKEKAKAFVVNNYAFLVRGPEKIKSIEWDCFNSGKDGFEFDVCQLIYLAFKNNASIHLGNASPTWDMRLDGKSVSYREIELSYIDMISAFANDDHESLWKFHDGMEMTKAVVRYVKEKRY